MIELREAAPKKNAANRRAFTFLHEPPSCEMPTTTDSAGYEGEKLLLFPSFDLFTRAPFAN